MAMRLQTQPDWKGFMKLVLEISPTLCKGILPPKQHKEIPGKISKVCSVLVGKQKRVKLIER